MISNAPGWICCVRRSRSPPARRRRARAAARGGPRARGGRPRPGARDLPGGALAALFAAGWPWGGRGRGERGGAGRPRPRRPPRPPDLLLRGPGDAVHRGERGGGADPEGARWARSARGRPPAQEARWLWLAGRAAADLWDDETWRLLSARSSSCPRHGRADGDAVRPQHAQLRPGPLGRAGRGRVVLDEIRAVTEATGMPGSSYGALWVAALRGPRGGVLGADRGRRQRRSGARRGLRAGDHRAAERGPVQRSRPLRGALAAVAGRRRRALLRAGLRPGRWPS